MSPPAVGAAISRPRARGPAKAKHGALGDGAQKTSIPHAGMEV